MKRRITILTLLFISVIGFGQTDSIRGNQFELKGKIINEILLTPHCGVFAWGTVIEFEIIEYSDSNYRLESIGVVIPCPEFYEDGFLEVGKTYEITVADENQADFDFIIPNESILTKYKFDKMLWVIKADKKD